MDNVDAALLRFFISPDSGAWDMRASMGAASRTLGITRDAVRSRMQRMEDVGILTGWDVMVHPAWLGTRLTRFEVAVDEERKKRVIDQMALLDGARIIFDYHGAGVTGVFYTTPENDRLARLIESLAGSPPRVHAIEMKPPTVQPTQSAWRLIQALRHDPRAPLEDVAKRLTLSTKTVARRLRSLQEGRGAFLTVRTDFTRIEGAMIAEARVRAANPDAFRREVEEWDGITFLNEAGPTVVFSILVPSPMEVTRLARRLNERPAVHWSECNIVQQRILVDDWLDAQIDRCVG